MKLEEFVFNNELPDTEINEGILVGSASSKILDYVSTLESKLKRKDIPAQQANMIEGLISEAKRAAKEHKRIEDLFDRKKLTRAQARVTLDKLGEKYSNLLDKIKSYRKKQVMKGVAGGMLVLALVGLDKIFTNVKDAIETAKSDSNIEKVIDGED